MTPAPYFLPPDISHEQAIKEGSNKGSIKSNYI